MSSRFVGRLEQRATLPHERQHGRRGQQLPLRLRRGHLLRLTRREPPLHPSRALTLATPCTHSQPAARQAAQDGARAPRRVRRVGVLRSVHTRFVGRGRVAQALPRSRSGSIHRIAPYTLIPTCAHRIYRTHPTTHAAYSQQHFSASPCTSPSAAGCPQGGRQALVRPHEVDLREMPELSSTGARSRLRVSVCAPHCLHPAPPRYLRPPLRTRST